MKTKYYFPISILVFTAALFVVPGSFIPDSNLGSNVVTVITFLFGILAGFYIVVTTTDYNSFKVVVAEETANWILLYQGMIMYDRRQAARLATMIDRYILRSFDLEIIEYVRLTRPEFADVERFIRLLRLHPRLVSTYDKIHESFNTIVLKRQMLTVLSTRTLTGFQWAVLYILATLIIMSLFGIRDGHLFFDLAAVAISSGVVLIMVLIRDLDLFLWNEKTFGYEIYQNVLTTIGKLPYYPDQTIESHRIKITDKVYRVGERLDKHDVLSKRRIVVVDTAKKKSSAQMKKN